VANPFIYAEVRLPQDDLLTPPLAGLPAENTNSRRWTRRLRLSVRAVSRM